MSSQTDGGILADERARIAEVLSRYPHLSGNELSELKNWFQRVATPLDFGLLAADPAVSSQYRAYRKDHHDRLKAKDIAMAAIMVAIVAGVIAIIAVLKP